MKRDVHAASRSGMALIITLVFVVLITILVVAMSTAVLIDRPAAKTHFEKARALRFAQAGVDQVVAVLRQNIGQTNRYWISEPGQIVVASTTANILNTTNLLYSGVANTTLTGVLQPQALNQATFQDPSTYLISGQPDSTGNIPRMQVAWVYVRQDGTQDFSASPVMNNAANPIMGRYAYWTDDESSKINLNLAWGRGTANGSASFGSPTKVDLTALPNIASANADAIHNFITTDGYNTLPNDFFNSPKDVRRVGSPVSAIMTTNQIYTTFYNHDPDLNCFSLPRIVLTTQKSKANGHPFLDILTVDNTDPGNPSNYSMAKVNAVLFGVGGTRATPVYPGLVWYLDRTDWPMAPGKSFKSKYVTGSPLQDVSECELAINIISYVCSKESTQSLVIPIRGSLQSTSITGTNVIGTGASFFGRTRAPMITEMGMWIQSPATVKGNPPRYFFTAEAVIEVYLPTSYGLSSVDLTKLAELIQYYNNDVPRAFVPSAISTSIAATNCTPSATLTAGHYVTITNSFLMDWINATNSVGATVPVPPRPTVLPMRAGISLGTSGTVNILDIAPTASSLTGMISVPIDGTGLGPMAIPSMEVDDPCVNLVSSDWQTNQTGGNSFGSINSCSTLHKPAMAGLFPQQDTDASGNLSDASLYMPPPAGSTYINPVTSTVDNNTAGSVSSVGELGYIHTGTGITGNEVPWRTLRLQPNGMGTNTVPDWALLDIFSVPQMTASTNAAYILTPHFSSVGGRININANETPFALNRTVPLAAAFLNCTNSQTVGTTLTAAQAQTVAQNIYNDTLSTNTPAGKQYGNVPLYYTPAQLAEISGVADKGEDSEQLLRQAINLLTTRGEVFSVYTVGQSLQQTPSGSLNVTGEERLQSIIERYLDTSVTPAAVRFRTVYYQHLTP